MQALGLGGRGQQLGADIKYSPGHHGSFQDQLQSRERQVNNDHYNGHHGDDDHEDDDDDDGNNNDGNNDDDDDDG